MRSTHRGSRTRGHVSITAVLVALFATFALALSPLATADASTRTSATAAAKKRAVAAKKRAVAKKAQRRRAAARRRLAAKKKLAAAKKARPQPPGGTGAPASAGASAGPRFGINAGGLVSFSDESALAVLQSMKAGGLTEVRRDMGWGQIEPAQGTFVWTETDRWMSLLARAGLRWFPTLDYSAPWASVAKTWNSRPAEPSTFATFAREVVARYGPGGRFWAEHPELPAVPVTHYEIWNEPNFELYWQEQASAPEDYADLFVAARDAIKAGDAGAKVVTAGLLERGGEEFIRRMYRHRSDLDDKVDAFGFHPYNPSAEDMLATVADIRRVLERVDPGVPMELTEAGFDTLRNPEAQRAIELQELVRGVRDAKLNVSALHVFSASTIEHDPLKWDQWLGLWNDDGTPKPSAVAYLAAVAAR